MNQNDDRILKINKKLDAANYTQKKAWRHNLAPKEYSVAGDWEDEEVEEEEEPKLLTSMPKKKKEKMGFLAVFFIMSSIFLLGAVGFALFRFMNEGLAEESISIDINAPISISSGEILKLDISVSNNNQVKLDTAELFIEYPIGTRSAEDITKPLLRNIKSLGEINTGEVVKHIEISRVFGEENEVVTIPIRLEYRIPASNSIFKVEKEIDLTLASSPIRLDVVGLERVTGGQAVEFDIAVNSNSQETLKNILVEAEYPFGFNYIDSNLEPIFNNRIWKIDEIKPGETIDINIDGVLTRQNSEDKFFKFSLGLQDPETREKIDVLLSEYEHVIKIDKPFIALDLSFNDQNEDVIIINNQTGLTGQVFVQNTTQEAISDVEVVVSINENLFDQYTLRDNKGFFDSVKNEIIWNSQLINELKVLSPGDFVRLNFSFEINPFVKESGAVLSKPETTFDVLVSGERNNDRGVNEEIQTTTFKKIRFTSNLTLTGDSFYDNTKISNYGPIPPAAEQATSYTAFFEIDNPSSDISNAVMTTALPLYARWKDVIYPETEDVRYNETTRAITWNIGDIPAGTGYVSEARKMEFQVEIFPSTNQVGKVLPIIESSKFTGYDTYTKTNITRYLESFSTSTGDVGIMRGGAVVK